MYPEQVQRTLRKIGLRPQTAAGQNFLLDESIVASMVAAADVQEDDIVLEIGPGLGILTKALLETGAKVVAVELDQRLAGYAQKQFVDRKNFTLITDDIFKVNLPELFEDGKYKLVANLPYSGTSLIFRNFLTLVPRPSSMTVMVQRDVAQRITAEPGDLSTLAVMVQYYSRPEQLFDVPAKSFFPVPNVTSTILHLDQLKPVGPDRDSTFFRIVRAGFSSRRKTLINSLAGSLRISPEEVTKKMANLSLKSTIRAQEISVETWVKIAEIFG